MSDTARTTPELDFRQKSIGVEGLPVVAAPAPEQNQILNALPPEARERLFPHLRLVELPLGKVLYESGGRLRHIYFPIDAIVSLLYVLENGASAEIAVVGNEGVLGCAAGCCCRLIG